MDRRASFRIAVGRAFVAAGLVAFRFVAGERAFLAREELAQTGSGDGPLERSHQTACARWRARGKATEHVYGISVAIVYRFA